jgi:UV DNA damage endonuclease
MSSPDAGQIQRAGRELDAAAALLDAMGLGIDAVIVVHVGGTYGDRLTGRERFAQTYSRLSSSVRRRLALENDDRSYSVQDVLWIHQRTGVRVVLDTLHHHCLNPAGSSMTDALIAALRTWPVGEQPKIHYSSPRTALRRLYRNGRWRLQPPLPNQHSDFIHPFEFISFLRTACAATTRPFDIMLEAKAQDLSLLRLREQVARFAPDLAASLG